MQKQIVRIGITLFAGAFSLLACDARGTLNVLDRSAEMLPDAKPTATSMTVPPTHVSEVSLPDLGLAPDIQNGIWLNSDLPLSIDTLSGKVVLLEFWTFG